MPSQLGGRFEFDPGGADQRDEILDIELGQQSEAEEGREGLVSSGFIDQPVQAGKAAMQYDFIDRPAAKRRCHQGDHRGHGTLRRDPQAGPQRPDGPGPDGPGSYDA